MKRKYRYLWSRQHLVDCLNSLGYVHFSSKEQVKSFEEGRAFYYSEETKEYGYVPVVPNDEIGNIKANEEYLFSKCKELNMTLTSLQIAIYKESRR